MSIGHPDFLGAVSPSPPQFIQALGPYGGGAAWGPVSVAVPSGGSYHLAIFPAQTNLFQLTDVTVNHLDARGVPVWQDFFGGVLTGNALPGGAGNNNAAVVRGNIYGVTLQISGLSATAAQMNALIPGHSFTGTGLSINVYTTPFALDDPQPKVTVAAAAVGVTGSRTPQGLLAAMQAVAVPLSSATPNLPVLSYAGPAVIDITQSGIASPANAVLNIISWTVANQATGAVSFRRYQGLATNQVNVFPINLPPLLHIYSFQNNDPANAATVYMLLTAGKAA